MSMYEYKSDLRGNEHYLSSSENKASTGFELVHIHLFLCSSHLWFSYIYTLRVYLEPTSWSAPSRFFSSIGGALHRYRRGKGFKSLAGLIFFQSMQAQAFAKIPVRLIIMYQTTPTVYGKLIYEVDMQPYIM